jgi:hypothetical protein
MPEAMGRYASGRRGGSVIPSNTSDPETGGGMGVNISYNGPTLSFNGDDYLPRSAVPELINAAAQRGAAAGQAKTFRTLQNSRSQRSIEISNADGTVQHRFQNSQVGTTIAYRSSDYPYLSFIYQGAAKNRTGDNLESSLVLATNALSMGYAAEAVQKRWNVRVDSCSMNPATFVVARTLTTEFWIAASMSYDPETIEVLLSSSIDAVGANAPTRVLTTALVGALPTTGQIYNR